MPGLSAGLSFPYYLLSTFNFYGRYKGLNAQTLIVTAHLRGLDLLPVD